MYGLNRFEASNYTNGVGDGLQLKWIPRFVNTVLNFRCMSTALRLVNGGGKSSLANAKVALISRDRTLLKETRSRFPPNRENCRAWGHVRIEMLDIDPDAVMSGALHDDNADRERWVFGYCGFRGKDSEQHFYFYKGGFEDAPTISKSEDGRTFLTTNSQFRQYVKNAAGSSWGPTAAEWRHRMSRFISEGNAARLAQFQKSGSSDKAAQFFEIKVPRNERYDQTFFYEFLAPEILSGIMHQFGEKDEDSFEKTLYKSLSKSVQDEQSIARGRSEERRYADLKERTGNAAAHYAEAKQHEKRYNKQHQDMAVSLAAIRKIAIDDQIPGTPNVATPSYELEAKLSLHTVIAPGRGIMIEDEGLAQLLKIDVRRVNEIGKRNGLKSSKLSQVVENTCDSKRKKLADKGPKSSYYAIDEAKNLIKQVSDIPDGTTRGDLEDALEGVHEWMARAIGESPIRAALNQIEEDMAVAEDEIGRIESQLPGLQQQERDLADEESAYEEGEGAYLAIRKSIWFEDGEAEQAAELEATLTREKKAADTMLTDFERRSAILENMEPDWTRYVQEHGPDTDPSALEHQYLEAQNATIEASQTAERREKQIKSNIKTLAKIEPELVAAERSAGAKLKAFEQLQKQYLAFTETFMGQSPQGFEARQRQAFSELQADEARLDVEIKALEKSIDALFAFRQSHGENTDPAAWIADVTEQRERAQITRQEIRQLLSDLREQRSDLQQEKVAPTRDYRRALSVLDAAGISVLPLHESLRESDLGEAMVSDAITQFSAVAFAPVAPDSQTAIQAADALEKEGIQLPCFVGPALYSYVKSTDSKRSEKNITGLLAGIYTRQVACLIDPSLIARELERVEKEIESHAKEESKLTGVIDRYNPEGREVTYAREAAHAITTNVEERLPQARDEIAKNTDNKSAIESNLKGDRLTMIREAEQYQDKGGKQGLEDASLAHDEAIQKGKENREEIERLETQAEEASHAVEVARTNVTNAYPAPVQLLIEAAIKFSKADGPQWLLTRDQDKQSLEDSKKRADERFGMRGSLESAAKYLAIKAARGGKKTPKEALADLRKNLDELLIKQKALSSDVSEHKTRLPTLSQACDKVDEVIAQLFSQWRLAASIGIDINPDEMQAEEVNEHDLCLCATALSRDIQRVDIEAITESAEAFRDAINELDIKPMRDTLIRYKRDRETSTENMMTAINHLRQNDSGIAGAERELLNSITGLGAASIVETLATNYTEKHQDSVVLLEKLERDVGQSQTEYGERMAMMIGGAKTNLGTMKRVLKERRNEKALSFELDVSMPTDEEALTLFNEIRGVIKADIVALGEKRNGQTVGTAELLKEDDRIVENIGKMCYRRLFKSPSIKFSSPIIRPDGNFHQLTHKLSSGEKTAISLSWIVRLTEYAIERDASKFESTAKRKKARENQQTVIIIDGLFSDLSKPKLIDAGLVEIQNTRGHLQIIGLIHSPDYVNNFDYFPVYLIGQEKTDGYSAWTDIENEETREAKPMVALGELRMRPSPGSLRH